MTLEKTGNIKFGGELNVNGVWEENVRMLLSEKFERRELLIGKRETGNDEEDILRALEK